MRFIDEIRIFYRGMTRLTFGKYWHINHAAELYQAFNFSRNREMWHGTKLAQRFKQEFPSCSPTVLICLSSSQNRHERSLATVIPLRQSPWLPCHVIDLDVDQSLIDQSIIKLTKHWKSILNIKKCQKMRESTTNISDALKIAGDTFMNMIKH